MKWGEKGKNFTSNEKKLSEAPMQISTLYSSFTGDKTSQVAHGAAAGKYSSLVSVCGNLHPPGYITCVFILTR